MSSGADRRPIHRLAIVNRGEAAMRCIRAVKALRAFENSTLQCLALYTDVDRDATYVRHADRRIRLEAPAGPVRAYLDIESLLPILRESGADAVWPGWGFLAEDPEFADRVVAEGLRFLGPTGDVIRAVGDKMRAKNLAEEVDVPVVPWSGGPVADVAAAARVAPSVGFPLLVKATAGGGGRGIRVVETASDLESAFADAQISKAE